MVQLRFVEYWLSVDMYVQKQLGQYVLRAKVEPEQLLMLQDYPYVLLWFSYILNLINLTIILIIDL